MTILGYLIWIAVGLLALVPIIGLAAEMLDWHKEKTIEDYEKEHGGSV